MQDEEAAALLRQAARCFAAVGRCEDAAHCYERAGSHLDAAQAWRAAGRHPRAADAYRRAGRLADAVECLLAGGTVDVAVAHLDRLGDPLHGAWLLMTQGGAVSVRVWTDVLLRKVQPVSLDEVLRLSLARGVYRWLWQGQDEPLVLALLEAERRLPELTRSSGGPAVRDWAVRAAGLLERPDLGARVHAAAHRAGLADALSRWRAWAQVALGGTAGVPEGRSGPAGAAS